MNTIISDLQDPGSLPDRTENVSVLQTHISVVFVADFFVYKIKKPVDFGFLDFSTLEKRKYYCEQEVKLNRRLSRGVYLDVLPVLYDGTRHSLKGGEGEAVEYAVKMKRIPDEVLMKSLFYVRALTEGHLKTVADRLAAFHLQAERSPEIDVFGEAVKFKINTDENF
ncbi:MAG: aminoglycoside phosphotransferase, partial [Deltaproteobacteria bacterium]